MKNEPMIRTYSTLNFFQQQKLRPLYLWLILLMFLSSCKIYSKVVDKQAISTSLVQEINTISSAADTNQIILLGLVTELETDDPVLFGTVAVYENDRLVGGTETDFDGHFYYQLKQIQDSLTYTLEFTYLGMHSMRIEDFKLAQGDSSYLVVKLGHDEDFGKHLGPFCPSWRVPLIEQDNTTSGQTFTSDQIRHSPTRGK